MFQDREEAGKLLAAKLQSFKGVKNLIILAIPRGGVVVGRELAQALNCPLDVLVTKKIGAPGNPELAIGAVGPDGTVVLNQDLALRTRVDKKYLKSQISNLKSEVARRIKDFRGDKPPLKLKNKTVILADDGIATGATIEASIKWIRSQKPKKVILAMPVAAPDSIVKLTSLVNEVICLDQPYFFAAVGQFYQSFPQVSNEEVIALLKKP
jgi:putative phosphoribosyl transferase